MTEVFSTLMTMMTIITMGGDNLPNETNNPRAIAVILFHLDGELWGRGGRTAVDRLNAGRTSGRVLFLRSSSVRRSLKQKPIRKRAGLHHN